MNKERKVLYAGLNAGEKIKNCRRLGYEIISTTEGVETIVFEDEVLSYKKTTIVVERDVDLPCYKRLVEIENNIDKLEKNAENERMNIEKQNNKASKKIANGAVGLVMFIGYLFAFICAAVSTIFMIVDFGVSTVLATLIFLGVGVGLVVLRNYLGKKIDKRVKTSKELEEINAKIEELYQKADALLNKK